MIFGSVVGKEETMKKHEKTKKEHKYKKMESWFQSEGSERWSEMMKQFCEGQTGVPDCCTNMKKMCEGMQNKAREKESKGK